jgi:prepilin-type N-terminal cleavage/methylation domain-containing protein
MAAAHSAGGRPRGFTLIEILVVVAIIALLIAILLPSLAGARGQAKKAVCMSNLHQFGIAFGLYGSDNRHQPPGNVNAGTAALDYRDSDWWYYPHMIAKYLPTDKKSQTHAGFLGVFDCPADEAAGRGYAMNFSNARDQGSSKAAGSRNPYTMKFPARYLLLGEANAIFLDPATRLYGPRHIIGQGQELSPYAKFRTVLESGDRGPFNGYITFQRHWERASFLLCDLSTRSLRTAQVVDDARIRSRMEVWWMLEDPLSNPPAP